MIKNFTKILAILIIFIIIGSTNIVNAQENIKYNLYSKENLYCFKYKNYLYRSEFVVYNSEDQEHPAYCLNKELDGVSLKNGGYTVELTNLITNNLVRKAIINGYPYKTYQELGCNNEMEAYTATKLAVYDMLYNYNFEDFIPVNETGVRVIAAIKSISNSARNSNETKVSPEIKIISDQNNWEIDEKDKQCISKIFKVEANSQISNYIIHISEAEGTKITNIDNEEKNVFKSSEEFKILIPIEKMNTEEQVEITANANLKTLPIYYGKAPDNLQNYAITGIEYENAEIKIIESIPQNYTTIEISKIDKHTKEPIDNCEFLITSEDGKIQYQLITDIDGMAKQIEVLPGKYKIKEQKCKDGYVKLESEMELEVKLNDKKLITIENEKEEIKPPIENIKEEVKPSTEKIKLPKTGF